MNQGTKNRRPPLSIDTIQRVAGVGAQASARARIAYYKCVSLVAGTNIVRRELGLPEAHIRAADPKLYFASVDGL